MSRQPFEDKGFLDHLSAPLTLLPLAAGLSLLLIAWALPAQRALLLFGGVVGLLLGLGLLVTQWALTAGDPRLARLRQEFAAALEAEGAAGGPEEAKLTTAPAPAEGP